MPTETPISKPTCQPIDRRPDVVGAMHATVADDGPASAAAPVVQAGPQTTGLYHANAAIARQAATQKTTYTWELEGTSYPFFALRTTDGGALVFYTMTLATTTVATRVSFRHERESAAWCSPWRPVSGREVSAVATV